MKSNAVRPHALVEAHDPKGEMFFRSPALGRLSPSTVRKPFGRLLLEELYSFVGEGWEPDRRHHSPYAEAFLIPK